MISDNELIAPPPPASEVVGTPGSNPDIDVASMEWDAATMAASEPFVGKWHRLISQTNWEKGRIILEWRTALTASGALVSAYSDESWAKQVGAVTSQHVGRLRRVYDRFGETQASYAGLFWSHFLAAIDWDDAELWLEGAARSQWSISQMRRMRAESMGATDEAMVRDEELIASEMDDGFVSLVPEGDEMAEDRDQDSRIESGPRDEGPDFGDADSHSDEDQEHIAAADSDTAVSGAPKDMGNPFATLGELPPDVADAVEQMKLCIIRHRATSWSEFSQAKMLTCLDALRVFASQ